jgi:hypothetical protein
VVEAAETALAISTLGDTVAISNGKQSADGAEERQ